MIRVTKKADIAKPITDGHFKARYTGVAIIKLDVDPNTLGTGQNLYLPLAASVFKRIWFRELSVPASSCEGHWLHLLAQS